MALTKYFEINLSTKQDSTLKKTLQETSVYRMRPGLDGNPRYFPMFKIMGK